MKKTAHKFFVIFLFALTSLAAAKDGCDPQTLATHKQKVLACYLAEPEVLPQPWVLYSEDYDPNKQVSIQTYTLSSQTWPKPDLSQHGLLWQHTLVIYRPDVVKTDQALLYVEGGNRYAALSDPQHFHFVDFARIASETQSVVIDLKDVPNQALTFDDGHARREDGIIAYTWNRYLDHPDQGYYWPAHLPMTKAVIKAMDATQQILEQRNIKISRFVVAGASKRGWATWLTALSDARVNAIVPIVIDILNTKENILHIYSSYNNTWPVAFHDYVEQKIPDRLKTPEFDSLMGIEDPLSYLNCEHCEFYRTRLSIPKYIISASGDDFFVPDSLNLYLARLPGENRVRVLPNQSHFVDLKIVESALLAYYRTIIQHAKRPDLRWRTTSDGDLKEIITDQRPFSVKLWEAVNPKARDFRLASKITYTAKVLTGKCVNNHCIYPLSIPAPLQGWKADFVEVSFYQGLGEPLVLTTPTYIKGQVNKESTWQSKEG